jgi:hypothetical protein
MKRGLVWMECSLLVMRCSLIADVMYPTKWLASLTVDATVLGSIPASADTEVLNKVHRSRPNGPYKLKKAVCYIKNYHKLYGS